MSTIQDRGYVDLEQRRFAPTELGFLVNDKLVQHFPDVVDVQFTAGVEAKLDDVEEGKQNWVDLLKEWYEPFAKELALAKTEMEKVGPVETDFDCPNCGKKMVLKRGRFGNFLSCSDYPECKTSMDIDAEGNPAPREEKVAPVIEGIDPEATRECEKCGKPMAVRTSRMGVFWGCTGYPKCKNLIPIEGAKVQGQTAPEVELTEHECPNCGKPLALRKGRFGPFLGCSGYPECKTIVKLDKDGNPRMDTATAPDGKRPDAAGKTTAKKATAKKATTKKKTTAKKPAAKKAAAKKEVATVEA